MRGENMTLKQVLEKYPHLAEMHIEEIIEQENINEKTDNKKDLLLG